MTTSHDRNATAGVVRRVSLAGCLMLAGASLLLGIDSARTSAQPPAPKAEPPAAKAQKATGMRLNHVDLAVPDVKTDREFFEKHFGFKCLVTVGDDLAVLTDGSDFSLVLSGPEVGADVEKLQRGGKTDAKNKGTGTDAKKKIEYPAGFHVGFHQDSKESVDAMYKKLKDAGVTVDQPQDYHGAWTFYVKAPGGYFVEVFHQPRRGGGR
ncbi:VOC family protein [Frigoriglobus tundricola]|uniref:VOC domain-containing protein n=1 Tax=Frigoriglobus tundricola TaxID=2774151 RepID=A0A6M5Z0Z9_9BACT|nr:VOC family protein [Frigoriglobus tundricola]QJX00010.1 hypothetical protein FTUN_7632 [Frigoriglobus tundricola]